MINKVPNGGLQNQWSAAGFTTPFNVTVGTNKVGTEYYLDTGGNKVNGVFDNLVLPCDVQFTVGP